MKFTEDRIRYIDRPEIPETFADSVTGLMFDGHILWLELGVTRLDEGQPPKPLTGRRYPAARLVLSSEAAVELSVKLAQFLALAEKQGLITRQPAAQKTVQ